MKKVIIVLLCICAFIACMGIGLLSGVFKKNKPEILPTLTSTIESSVIPQNYNQQNLILIQIDNLAAAKPRLETVWLLLFKPELPEITLLLLYPSPNEPYVSLAGNFNTTPTGDLDPAFNSLLLSFGFKYQGFVLLDEAGFIKWIDWLGGVNIDNNHLNGTQTLNHTPKAWQDAVQALVQQKVIASAICTRLGQLPTDTNWFPLLTDLMPEHMQTNLTLTDSVSTWNQMETSPSHFNCKTVSP